jgi:ATP-binding cassette subfamily B protein
MRRLLVDEATAALDAENQAAIAGAGAAARQAHGDRHRPPAVDGGHGRPDRRARWGVVREQGAPAALRAQGGLYAHFLAQRQAAKGWRIASAAPQQ